MASDDRVSRLETELNRPTRDETCFRPPGDADRIGALRELAELLPPPPERLGANLHVHTGKSFSLFFSPAAACWRARREGLEFFGINDHYTIAGFEEFGEACRILGLKPTFSMEAIAMDAGARERGELLNDPDNPGRTYFTAKGVQRCLTPGSPRERAFTGAFTALERRHRKMTRRASEWLRNHSSRNDFQTIEGLDWTQDVAGRTPHGNVTERHVAGAIGDALLAAADGDAVLAACAEWFGKPPESLDPAPFQGYLRKQLLKSGGACYVEESPEAYLSLEDMRGIYLEMGAIPTYPILGNPVTDVEEDVEALLDRLAGLGVYGVEVIPYRNTRERLKEVVDACRGRHVPVFTGTEHNSLDEKPLLDPLSVDPDFLPYFVASARVLLGHHAAARQGEPGFVTAAGKPSIADSGERFSHFEGLGLAV